jgi:hypothetical protein
MTGTNGTVKPVKDRLSFVKLALRAVFAQVAEHHNKLNVAPALHVLIYQLHSFLQPLSEVVLVAVVLRIAPDMEIGDDGKREGLEGRQRLQ